MLQNIFYGDGDSIPKAMQNVEWVMQKDTHSLPDGISHPSRSTRRLFLVNDEGEGVYLPLDLSSEDIFMPEFFFRKGLMDKPFEAAIR